MKFLTAHWENLILISYRIPKEVLLPYVPMGTELESFEGDYFVSLVGFMFKNTKVRGLKLPNHINFEEVNLRFYVVDKQGERGVVFIKEIVPKWIIKEVANRIYKEHYSVSLMENRMQENRYGKKITYQWESHRVEQSISAKVEEEGIPLLEGSKAEFIVEHYKGYTKVNEEITFSYEVEHPKWEQCQVLDYQVKVDFEKNYGRKFAFLNTQIADSVLFFKGSEVVVRGKRKLLI